MFSASMSVEKTLNRFSIADVASPCTARDVLAIRVKVAPPWALFWNWLRVHLRGGRPNKRKHHAMLLACSVGVIVGILFFMWARLYSVDLLATTEPPAQLPVVAKIVNAADAAPACSVPCALAVAQAPLSGRTAERRELSTMVKEATRGDWIRASLLLVGPWAIALVAVGVFFMRGTLCEVYVVGLLPHQPFPVIEQFLARSLDKHVIAIRFLSETTKQRFFGAFVDRLSDGKQSAGLSTLDVTHATVSNVVAPEDDDERQQYWALVRYGIGLMLSRHSVVRQSAIGFTYKLHEWFFIAYFVALGLVVVLPSTGWLPKTEESQFPLLMVGLGLVWAATLIVVHLGVVEHLRAWERMTSEWAPFNGCPIYRYTEQLDDAGQWHPLDLEDFRAPIREMGLPSDRMLEITLGIMLIIYLTALQIVK